VRAEFAVARRAGRHGERRRRRQRGRREGGRGQQRGAAAHVGVGQALQLLADLRLDADGGQAPLRVAVVLADVLVHQRLQQLRAGRRQRAAVEQDGRQRLVLARQPRLHGLEQGVAVDEGVLQGQEAEQQVAVGRGGGHGGVLGLGP
jgi:hypothetical protein